MTQEIDISTIDKAELLAALFNNSKTQGLGVLHFDARSISKEQAEAWLEKTTYFDYLEGRVMKVELGGDTLNPCLYDRDNGQGAAARAIESMSSKGSACS